MFDGRCAEQVTVNPQLEANESSDVTDVLLNLDYIECEETGDPH